MVVVPFARAPERMRNENPKHVVSRTPYASRKGIHDHPHERREERDAKENKSAIKAKRDEKVTTKEKRFRSFFFSRLVCVLWCKNGAEVRDFSRVSSSRKDIL